MMKEYHADTAARTLLQLLVCLAAALLSAAALSLLAPWRILMWILITVFVGTAGILCGVCLPLLFSHLRAVVTSSQVTVYSGVLMHREQSVRLDRVQFVQLLTGPADGIFGLNFIILHVYGGQLMLLFLSRKDRIELMQSLAQRGGFYAP